MRIYLLILSTDAWGAHLLEGARSFLASFDANLFSHFSTSQMVVGIVVRVVVGIVVRVVVGIVVRVSSGRQAGPQPPRCAAQVLL